MHSRFQTCGKWHFEAVTLRDNCGRTNNTQCIPENGRKMLEVLDIQLRCASLEIGPNEQTADVTVAG